MRGKYKAIRHNSRFQELFLWIILFLGIGFFALWWVFSPYKTSVPERWTMITCDVGQGDMALLRTGENSLVIIDVGPPEGKPQRCLDLVPDFTVQAVFLTHPHQDHIGGLKETLANLAQRGQQPQIVTSTTWDPSSDLSDIITFPIHQAQAGEKLQLGSDATFAVLHPSSHPGPVNPTSAEENNDSLVLWAELTSSAHARPLSVLLTGDIEKEAVDRIVRAYPELNVDILKVPHHGSRSSGTKLTTSFHPRIATISAAYQNSYGHPHPEILDALQQQKTLTVQTSQCGHIVLSHFADEHRVDLNCLKP